MKILTGQLKGRNFYMPAHIRPTQNITRKAIFDIIGHNMNGKNFLDLFSGSGAVGLEAYSSGAQRVVMVEKDSKCFHVIEQNCLQLNIPDLGPDGRECRPFCMDVFAAIKSFSLKKERFDVVFLDPPYDQGLGKKALKTLEAYDILHPNSVIIVECGKREGLPYAEHDFEIMTERKYGKSYLVIFKKRDS